MITRRKWTKEEEEILVQAIEANPHNIMDVFRCVSAKLGRTENACRIHWYQVMSPANNPTKLGVSFLAIGPKSVYKNRKNSGNAFIKPEENTLWMKIKKFIGLK